MSCFTESTTRGTLILGCSNLKVFFIGILLEWKATDCVRVSDGVQCNVYGGILPCLKIKLMGRGKLEGSVGGTISNYLQ